MLCGTRAHRARWKMKFVPNKKRVASDKLNQIQYNLMYSSVLRLHSDDREWEKNRCRALSYHRSLLLASIYMYCNDNFATMLFRFYEWNVRCIFWYGFGSVGGCVRWMCSVYECRSAYNVCAWMLQALWLTLSLSALSVFATYRVEFTSLRISKLRLNGISANRNVVLNTAHISEVLVYFCELHSERKREEEKNTLSRFSCSSEIAYVLVSLLLMVQFVSLTSF